MHKNNKRKKCLTKEWIVNFISDNGANTEIPQIVKVLKHQQGPNKDGSLEGQVSDGNVFIRAIFTKESTTKFILDHDELSPPELDKAILVLKKYQLHFEPHSQQDQCEFFIVVEEFVLWSAHPAFDTIENCMDDRMVQTCVVAAWNAWSEREKGALDSNSMSMSSVSSQLLEAMANQSVVSQGSALQQADDKPSTSNLQEHWSVLVEKSFCVEDFIIPDNEMAVINSIEEWKEDYRPPPLPQSTEVSLQSLQSPTEIFAGPTLVDDVTKRPQNVSLPSIPKKNVITADVHQQVTSTCSQHSEAESIHFTCSTSSSDSIISQGSKAHDVSCRTEINLKNSELQDDNRPVTVVCGADNTHVFQRSADSGGLAGAESKSKNSLSQKLNHSQLQSSNKSVMNVRCMEESAPCSLTDTASHVKKSVSETYNVVDLTSNSEPDQNNDLINTSRPSENVEVTQSARFVDLTTDLHSSGVNTVSLLKESETCSSSIQFSVFVDDGKNCHNADKYKCQSEEHIISQSTMPGLTHPQLSGDTQGAYPSDPGRIQPCLIKGTELFKPQCSVPSVLEGTQPCLTKGTKPFEPTCTESVKYLDTQPFVPQFSESHELQSSEPFIPQLSETHELQSSEPFIPQLSETHELQSSEPFIPQLSETHELQSSEPFIPQLSETHELQSSEPFIPQLSETHELQSSEPFIPQLSETHELQSSEPFIPQLSETHELQSSEPFQPQVSQSPVSESPQASQLQGSHPFVSDSIQARVEQNSMQSSHQDVISQSADSENNSSEEICSLSLLFKKNKDLGSTQKGDNCVRPNFLLSPIRSQHSYEDESPTVIEISSDDSSLSIESIIEADVEETQRLSLLAFRRSASHNTDKVSDNVEIINSSESSLESQVHVESVEHASKQKTSFGTLKRKWDDLNPSPSEKESYLHNVIKSFMNNDLSDSDYQQNMDIAASNCTDFQFDKGTIDRITKLFGKRKEQKARSIFHRVINKTNELSKSQDKHSSPSCQKRQNMTEVEKECELPTSSQKQNLKSIRCQNKKSKTSRADPHDGIMASTSTNHQSRFSTSTNCYSNLDPLFSVKPIRTHASYLEMRAQQREMKLQLQRRCDDDT